MVILCNGDSWTQGDSPAQQVNWNVKESEIFDDYQILPSFSDPYVRHNLRATHKFYNSPVWPKVLGNSLEIKTYNTGRLGRSNYDIAISTVKAVNTLLNEGIKEIFVVIGWSSLLRKNIFCYNGKLDRPTPMQIRPLTEGFEHVYQDILTLEDAFANNIYLTQQYLTSKGIDFLFFNAFDTFTNYKNTQVGNTLDKTKWLNEDITSSHFLDFLNQHSIENDIELVNNSQDTDYLISNHPTDKSHKLWGSYLSQEIVNKVK